MPDTGRAEEHGDSKERFIEDDDCFLKNANFDTYKASIWMEKHQVCVVSSSNYRSVSFYLGLYVLFRSVWEMLIKPLLILRPFLPERLTILQTQKLKAKLCLSEQLVFMGQGSWAELWLIFTKRSSALFSTTQRKEANELLDQMVQKRFVSSTPLYRSYRETDELEASALLAFAHCEVDDDIDEPFVCLFNAKQ